MNSDLVISEVFQALSKDLIWNDYLVRNNQPGHTDEASKFGICHEGRTSADYYSFASLTGSLDESFGIKILQQLESLQVADTDSPYYGCMRWYREETKVNDTNAAFFILMPLTTVRLLHPERLFPNHLSYLDRMMNRAVSWFRKEIEHPLLYYPNKVISDGALLLALSVITGREEDFRRGVHFFERWEAYTERRGWGWGENLSLHYLNVIVNALKLACCTLQDKEAELYRKLNYRIMKCLAFIRFQEQDEFVPTIRSYNFDGKVAKNSFLWSIVFPERNPLHELKQESIVNNWALTSFVTLVLFKDYMGKANSLNDHSNPSPRMHKEHITDHSFSYTWIGDTGKLGSINKFPVIPGMYQQPTWGNGWQSFPVSFLVRDVGQVGYLRWHVHAADVVRTHPAETVRAYLRPALFEESVYPDVRTRCCQSENKLIAVRSMTNVSNRANTIVDEWVIHRFRGEIKEMNIDYIHYSRKWWVLTYQHAVVAITALQGITAFDTVPQYHEVGSHHARQSMSVEVDQRDDTLLLKQVLYRGEEKQVVIPRLEAAWAVIYFDERKTDNEIEIALKKANIEDGSYSDYEVPRTGFTEIRSIKWFKDENEIMRLTIDPHYEDSL